MRSGLLFGLVLVGLVFASNLNSAQARPGYLKAFKTTYKDVAKANKVTCAACHPVKDKKVRNDYGKALGKNIGKKNEKDAKKIAAGLKKTEKNKNKDGKTFGSILEAGKLP
jgi:cytochrome c553